MRNSVETRQKKKARFQSEPYIELLIAYLAAGVYFFMNASKRL